MVVSIASTVLGLPVTTDHSHGPEGLDDPVEHPRETSQGDPEQHGSA